MSGIIALSTRFGRSWPTVRGRWVCRSRPMRSTAWIGGLFGAPDELRRRLAEMAEQMQGAQRVAWADNAIRLAVELTEWNRRVNLTALTDPLDVARKHFLDSLSVLSACDVPHNARLIDVGSGAGFPGLPLRIARPDLRVTLLEASRKKCDFLRHAIEALELDGVAIVNARAEEAGRDPSHREGYAVAAARAVAETATLVEYLLPFVQVGGMALALKSGQAAAEVARAEAAVAALGGRVQRSVPVEVPGLDDRRVVVIVEKVAPTPDKYPRRAGMPAKRPIG